MVRQFRKPMNNLTSSILISLFVNVWLQACTWNSTDNLSGPYPTPSESPYIVTEPAEIPATTESAPTATLHPPVDVLDLRQSAPLQQVQEGNFQELFRVEIVRNPDYYPYDSRVAISPDAQRFVVNRGWSNWIIDLETGRVEQELSGHVNTVTSLAWSSDGRYIVATGRSGLMTIWSTFDGTITRQVALEGTSIWKGIWSPDGLQLALLLSPCRNCDSPSTTSGLWLWSFESGQLVKKIADYGPHGALDVAWGLDPGQLLVFGQTVYAATVDSSLPGPAEFNFVSAEYTYAADWSPDGRYIAMGGDNAHRGWFSIWDVNSNRELLSMTGLDYLIHQIEWAPSGRQILINTEDSLGIWDFDSDSQLNLVQTLPYGEPVLWSQDGQRIVISNPGSEPALLRIFEAVTADS